MRASTRSERWWIRSTAGHGRPTLVAVAALIVVTAALVPPPIEAAPAPGAVEVSTCGTLSTSGAYEQVANLSADGDTDFDDAIGLAFEV